EFNLLADLIRAHRLSQGTRMVRVLPITDASEEDLAARGGDIEVDRIASDLAHDLNLPVAVPARLEKGPLTPSFEPSTVVKSTELRPDELFGINNDFDSLDVGAFPLEEILHGAPRDVVKQQWSVIFPEHPKPVGIWHDLTDWPNGNDLPYPPPP